MTYDPLSSEGYAATGGLCCPACGATALAHGRCDATDPDTVTRRGACQACGASWTAVYELTGYEGLVRPREETRC